MKDHQLLNQSKSVEWYTPEPIIKRAKKVLGNIDLDPASCEEANKIIKARHYFTKEDNGLDKPWHGNVWLNPPYGKINGKSNQAVWSQKLITEYHLKNVTEAILLVNAVPGNAWFRPLWKYVLCFPYQRIRFIGAGSQPTQSNVLVYFGNNTLQFTEAFKDIGAIVLTIV